jgi:DNA helicase-2/ATP-dependent DNA helicase PcrA
VAGGIKIDEAAHVKDVLSLARIADNPMNEPAWLRCLSMLPGVGAKGAAKLAEKIMIATSGGKAIHDAVAAAAWPKKTDPTALAEAFRALSSPASPGVRLERAVAKLETVLRERYRDDWKDRKKDIQTLCGLASDHPSMTGFLAAVTIDYGLDSSKKAGPADRPDEEPLRLSTIHSAKGLEWGCVHIPSFRAGHLPSAYAETPEELDEELRVFYVAASRAARRLVLYRPLLDDGGSFAEDSAYASLVEEWTDRVKAVADAGGTAAKWNFGSGTIDPFRR